MTLWTPCIWLTKAVHDSCAVLRCRILSEYERVQVKQLQCSYKAYFRFLKSFFNAIHHLEHCFPCLCSNWAHPFSTSPFLSSPWISSLSKLKLKRTTRRVYFEKYTTTIVHTLFRVLTSHSNLLLWLESQKRLQKHHFFVAWRLLLLSISSVDHFNSTERVMLFLTI